MSFFGPKVDNKLSLCHQQDKLKAIICINLVATSVQFHYKIEYVGHGQMFMDVYLKFLSLGQWIPHVLLIMHLASESTSFHK